jgi:hypothetical protein
VRVAVIGDIGGHLAELRAEIRRLGAAADGTLPPDLTVVQVGDLIHRGPDSNGVIQLVDWYLRNQPEQWIQLIGNHEIIYLRSPMFTWPDRLRRRSSRTLRRWWREGRAVVAVALPTAEESFLVTHAGVTAGFWKDVLDSPGTAEDAAQRINELAAARDGAVFRAGCVLDGRVNPLAGPLWADSTAELVPSWIDTRMPFSQIHGHTTITDWGHGASQHGLLEFTTVDPLAKHETVHLPGGRLIGIDPGHASTPSSPWRALELRCRNGHGLHDPQGRKMIRRGQ